jgi:hypothetical protein
MQAVCTLLDASVTDAFACWALMATIGQALKSPA